MAKKKSKKRLASASRRNRTPSPNSDARVEPRTPGTAYRRRVNADATTADADRLQKQYDQMRATAFASGDTLEKYPGADSSIDDARAKTAETYPASTLHLTLRRLKEKDNRLAQAAALEPVLLSNAVSQVMANVPTAPTQPSSSKIVITGTEEAISRTKLLLGRDAALLFVELSSAQLTPLDAVSNPDRLLRLLRAKLALAGGALLRAVLLVNGDPTTLNNTSGLPADKAHVKGNAVVALVNADASTPETAIHAALGAAQAAISPACFVVSGWHVEAL